MNGRMSKIARGHRLWFCDGRLEFVADEVGENCIVTHLSRGSIPLKTSNSIYLPDTPSPFTMTTPEDLALLDAFAAEQLVPDWIALSFVSSAEDVRRGRQVVEERFGRTVRIMAKIETAAALLAVEPILREADGLMVARGDLGPAVDYVRLPEAQEQLVKAARRAGKVVVVATQILEQSAESGVPQRSELSGLALLAKQRPDAIMLAKETVYSAHPLEAIRLAGEVLTYETRRRAERHQRLPRRLRAASGQPPQVVAFEGPNGVGKTHVCRRLSQRLGWPSLRGVPGPWEEATLKTHMLRDADWLASALYFLSGVIESSREIAGSTAERVLLDRSLWSTLAVHYAYDPSRLEQLLPLLKLVAERVRVPDLTIVLDASPEICRQRISGKTSQEQQWDAVSPDTADFARREREFYRWLATQGPRVVFLDTEGREPDEVEDLAAALIRETVRC